MVTASRRSSSKEHRGLIVCPQRLAREGLGALLSQEEDLSLVGLTADASEALASLSRLRPDVVIIVNSGSCPDCAAAVQQFKTTHPDLPVLLISSVTRLEDVQAALAAGANGYLPLDIGKDELIHAVHMVCRGELVLHPTLMRELLSHLADQSNEAVMHNLNDFSPREQEVLACLARGLTDRDIAQQLFISVRTVQTHLTHIYGKLGVHSRIEAALATTRAGWFSVHDDHPLTK